MKLQSRRRNRKSKSKSKRIQNHSKSVKKGGGCGCSGSGLKPPFFTGGLNGDSIIKGGSAFFIPPTYADGTVPNTSFYPVNSYTIDPSIDGVSSERLLPDVTRIPPLFTHGGSHSKKRKTGKTKKTGKKNKTVNRKRKGGSILGTITPAILASNIATTPVISTNSSFNPYPTSIMTTYYNNTTPIP
jgi:hypothetical protein